MEKGYVPYLLRYSKKKPRYRDYESRTRSHGPLMRGWHLFHDENLPIVAKILLKACEIRDFFLSLHYQNLPIVAKISNCMVEIKRDRYLLKLIESRHNGFIKVITGIRRCGKSYLLNVLFYHYLLENGVDDDHIIRIDLEDRINKDLRDPDTMLHYVHDRIKDRDLYYIIIDEVQLMNEFVDVLNSFRHIENADTYVTGSNSHFLSSDIPTEFRGRGETIHVSPLSFAEFYASKGGDKLDVWREYYTFGGLPLIQSFDSEEKKIDYLKNLFETVYLADIIERHKIKNEHEMRELVHIMASSIGSSCNPTKLSNTFMSVKNVKIGSKTISNYLTCLTEAFLLKKAIRYDIKGKKYINTLSKYYFADIGLGMPSWT